MIFGLRRLLFRGSQQIFGAALTNCIQEAKSSDRLCTIIDQNKDCFNEINVAALLEKMTNLPYVQPKLRNFVVEYFNKFCSSPAFTERQNAQLFAMFVAYLATLKEQAVVETLKSISYDQLLTVLPIHKKTLLIGGLLKLIPTSLPFDLDVQIKTILQPKAKPTTVVFLWKTLLKANRSSTDLDQAFANFFTDKIIRDMKGFIQLLYCYDRTKNYLKAKLLPALKNVQFSESSTQFLSSYQLSFLCQLAVRNKQVNFGPNFRAKIKELYFRRIQSDQVTLRIISNIFSNLLQLVPQDSVQLANETRAATLRLLRRDISKSSQLIDWISLSFLFYGLIHIRNQPDQEFITEVLNYLNLYCDRFQTTPNMKLIPQGHCLNIMHGFHLSKKMGCSWELTPSINRLLSSSLLSKPLETTKVKQTFVFASAIGLRSTELCHTLLALKENSKIAQFQLDTRWSQKCLFSQTERNCLQCRNTFLQGKETI